MSVVVLVRCVSNNVLGDHVTNSTALKCCSPLPSFIIWGSILYLRIAPTTVSSIAASLKLPAYGLESARSHRPAL